MGHHRRMLGYDRDEGEEPRRAMDRLYGTLRLYEHSCHARRRSCPNGLRTDIAGTE